MKLKVRIDFNEAQRVQILEFVTHVNAGMPPDKRMDVDEFCKRAVFYAMNDAYARAEKTEKANNEVTPKEERSGLHDAEVADHAGAPTEAPSVSSDTSDTLPNT